MHTLHTSMQIKSFLLFMENKMCIIIEMMIEKIKKIKYGNNDLDSIYI